MRFDLIHVKVRGMSPLLQHRFIFSDEKDDNKVTGGQKDYSQEWKASLYYDDTLGIYQPAVHIEAAMITAAASEKIAGKGNKTYKDMFKAAVFVTPEKIPHGITGDLDGLVKKGRLLVDRQRVTINKAAVERLRPRFEEWELSFDIEVHSDQISAAVVKKILTHAGAYIGIGDFRPKFGRFEVAEFTPHK